MFAVLFEVQPNPGQWDAYLATARALRPDLEQVDGFIENIRYRSLTREGWLLSLSCWRDEKALVRWRTQMGHHVAQEQGRAHILHDYHLRVGEIARDSAAPADVPPSAQRLDVTEVGMGTAVTMITARRPAEGSGTTSPAELAAWLGQDPAHAHCAAWDIFDAVLTPGDLSLLATWRSDADAADFEHRVVLPAGARLRRVRVIRDYGMFDRREAPQFYAEVKRAEPAPP